MNFLIQLDELCSALSRVSRAIVDKTSVPILADVLIEASDKDQRVTFTGFDLDKTVSSIHDGKVREGGHLTVNCALLCKLAKSLSCPVVEISGQKEKITVKCGSFSGVLNGSDADLYPTVFGEENPSDWITTRMDASSLAEALSVVMSPASTAPEKMNAVFWAQETVSGGGSPIHRFVSTDGHRMHVAEFSPIIDAGGFPAMKSGLLIPLRACRELHKLLVESLKEETEICVDSTERFLRFRRGPVSMTLRLLDSKFVDYQEMLPDYFDNSGFVVSRAEFAQALRCCQTFSDDKPSVLLRFYADRVEVSSSGYRGSGSVIVPGRSADETRGFAFTDQQIMFNAAYVLDALSSCPWDKVRLRVDDEFSPIVILRDHSEEGNPGYDRALAVVMPMRQ